MFDYYELGPCDHDCENCSGCGSDDDDDDDDGESED